MADFDAPLGLAFAIVLALLAAALYSLVEVLRRLRAAWREKLHRPPPGAGWGARVRYRLRFAVGFLVHTLLAAALAVFIARALGYLARSAARLIAG